MNRLAQIRRASRQDTDDWKGRMEQWMHMFKEEPITRKLGLGAWILPRRYKSNFYHIWNEQRFP